MAMALVFHFFISYQEIRSLSFLGGGGNLDFWGMILHALLLSIAFHLPEWQVYSETLSVPTLKSRMCPISVNNPQ